MNQFKIFLVVFVWLNAFTTDAQQQKAAVLEFSDEICLYKGYYNPDKYTENALRGTYQLVSMMLYFDGENLDELEKNYSQSKTELQDLDLVNVEFFKQQRDSMIRYLDESYEIQKMRITAEDDPSVLSGKFVENAKVKQYAEALNQGEDLLLKAYEDLVKEMMTKNAYPEALWRKYQENLKSKDRLDIAYQEVLTYGWWNAVNNLIYHYPHDGRLAESFHKLFLKVVTIDCDEV